MSKFEELKFVRVYDFNLIPRYLFEQAKEYSDQQIDRIYQFGPGFIQSPATILYAAVNKENIIKGVLWLSVDVIELCVYVEALSIDKQYQDKTVLANVLEFVKSLPLNDAVKKRIVFTTSRPKVYEGLGFKKSKRIRMELYEEENTDNDTEKRTDVPDRPQESQ